MSGPGRQGPNQRLTNEQEVAICQTSIDLTQLGLLLDVIPLHNASILFLLKIIPIIHQILQSSAINGQNNFLNDIPSTTFKNKSL